MEKEERANNSNTDMQVQPESLLGESETEEVQGQSPAHAAGDVGALPRGQGEPDELMPPDAHPDTGVHRAIQRPPLRRRFQGYPCTAYAIFGNPLK